MPVLVQLLFQAGFVFCVCYAVVSDFRQLRIPNWIPLVLAATFAVFAPLKMEVSAFLLHLAIAGVVFLLMVGFFAANWIAGGDVKLLTATMLWMGPDHAAPFALLMALFGFILAMTLLGLRKYGFLAQHYLPGNGLLARMTTLADSGQVPYGVAIGMAALLMSNGVFRH